MADDYSQVESILKIVLDAPGVRNGHPPFSRGLRATTEIADISVTSRLVRVHPEWAVELGPVEAAKAILNACADFDRRTDEARERQLNELRAKLKEVSEAARRAGAEFLFEEVRRAPVPRSRSLTLWREP